MQSPDQDLPDSGLFSTFAGAMEDEVYQLLTECCDARKSHAVEYRRFLGVCQSVLHMSAEQAEDAAVGLLITKKATTLTFGGSCYLYINQ